ncbi:MAG: NAD(P)H-dependent glycerol-3-phosphate dehydrogenase [Deltaproteobacteria bacterium]|nr:NAD(P)H-dependent glycerol-3-phosphate dehydrogenase [Deltaproteobacteria bacterium]
MDKQFCVYILASKRNGTLYIGVTAQLATRVWQHKSKVVEGFSARYGVDKLVYYEAHGCAETAIVREKQLKKWRRAWKMTNCVPFGHGPRPDSTQHCQTGEDLPGRLHVTHRFVAHPALHVGEVWSPMPCASAPNPLFAHRMRIAVIGGGSWGTALAKLLAELEHEVTLWFHNPQVERITAEQRENSVYLAGFQLPEELRTTTAMSEAVAGAAVVLAVCPSHAMREVMAAAVPFLGPDTLLVSASKGVEERTLKRMSEVLVELAGWQRAGQVASLSGPSFAREVAAGMPTAVTVAAADMAVAERLQQIFLGPTFRVYASTDLIGVEIGGTVKNVIAIAAGVSDGLGFGSSTRAALITRGVAEIARLVQKLGGDPRTVSGLSGVGDLVLTCTGDLSRNRTVGLRLGRGERLADILAAMKMVAEGVKNSSTVCELARRAGVEMPIAEQVRQLLHDNKPARQVVGDLMGRQARPEFWS